MTIRLAELAEKVNGHIKGDGEELITSVATLENATSGQISYIAEKKYIPLLKQTRASAVILSEHVADQFTGNALIMDNPRLGFAIIAQLLSPIQDIIKGIHPSACIDEAATIDPDVSIGPQCVIGPHVRIGSGCIIYPNVTIQAGVQVGQECVIHAGVVIGADGFGFTKDQDQWVKVPQLGTVVIGNQVEIGANTTIDRGALENTIIEDGVKLDNLVQIAHNVHIGENTAIAACTGIAGSTSIGKRCTVGGQATILGHLQIVDDVHITASSLVTGSINKAGKYSSSIPAISGREWNKNVARLLKLDQLMRILKNK
ncbi:MAG TPA: UDP-3-O-(3-hydroxymyristoyl)glucosamine N-acyltransferase [Acidiferrobacteraceae bacterium]|nr:UDP-3-O-(3-hydroxymyristoyl)glucosamine N-acyltransferase [Acidiferrobacteraceae bacterium]HEX19954.1 UDP-3-O-(3-hydroxymyristoyl)glucosamine N-acyltransferase [Acidiferrobacteraceae bacterium]